MDKYLVRKRYCEDENDGDNSKRQRLQPDNEDCKESIELLEKTDEKDCASKTSSACSIFVMKPLLWRHIRAENLICDYSKFFSTSCADDILRECEKHLTYNEGQLAKVNIFGKWHDIPRRQVAHGDEGLSYTFSNNTVPARPWTPFLEKIRDTITEVTGYKFNFVLINRYRDGCDHMGEHRDDEKDLAHGYPIASLSVGAARDFIFKHALARGRYAKRKIPPVKITLEHGSLLMMKHPTNTHWYHSLPQRKRVLSVRINMTFRQMVKT